MKKMLALIFPLIAVLSGEAQHFFRNKISYPPYGLKKINRLISERRKGKPDEFPPAIVLNQRTYHSLSFREKFTYNMINFESYSQNCSLNFPPFDEGKKIFAYLPRSFDEFSWSDRQLKFFKDNRDSVIALMGESISREKSVGINYKNVIVDLDAVSLMPLLIRTYDLDRRDHDILTVLSLLMQQSNYKPFVSSDVCKELNAGQESYLKRCVEFKPANAEQILRLAAQFSAHTREKAGFVLVPKGWYTVGKAHFPVNPLRKVRVDSFYIAVYETTNREFAAFVAATGYRTDAERRHDALVFAPGLEEFRWLEDSTACWRYPNGVTRGGIEGKMDHPVTTISYSDIQAYCRWAGVRLPTLEEWEIACRAGTTTDYFFGDTDSAIGRYANIWHQHDHLQADSSDGYMYTAPVGSFAPNPWGLYDMYGNVFEFCTGKLRPDESPHTAHARGGSWWCSAASCGYFNSYDVGRINIHASFSNQGFRVVR